MTSFKEDALFIRTIARAQGYDFKAYQALLEIGRGTNDNARLANQVMAEIDRSLARDRSDFTPRRTFVTVAGTNFYSGPFTSDELAICFSNVSHDQSSFNREGFVNTVAGLKQPLFLPLLMDFFANETDLGVADRLTIAISDLTKEDFHPRDFERIANWWKHYHNSFTNWPLEILENASREFSSVHYRQAAEAFKQVLKLDSGADMSRAFAIACYLDTGLTNRATTLAKEFKHPSARWAQWTTAKAERETGNVSNETVRCLEITTNLHGMIYLTKNDSPFFRHVDLRIYDKLSGQGAR